MADENSTDLLDELEFRRGRTVRSATKSRDVNSTTSIIRSARATSVLPASIGHFENLAEGAEDYFGQQLSNEGLHRARRALSEARLIARNISRAASVERESSSYEAVERSRMSRSSMQKSQSRTESEQRREDGNYKITVTPRAQDWSSLSGSGFSGIYGSRSATRALLAKYNPRGFPDFIFGSYSGSRQRLEEPTSSSLKYYDTAAGSSLADEFDDSFSSSRSRSAAQQLDSSATKRRSRSSKSYDHLLEDSAAMRFYDLMARAYGLDTASQRRTTNYEYTAQPLKLDRTTQAYFDKYDVGSRSRSVFADDIDDSYLADTSKFSRSYANRSSSVAQDERSRSSAYDAFGSSAAKSYYGSNDYDYDALAQEADSLAAKNRFERSRSSARGTSYDRGQSSAGKYYDAVAQAYGIQLDGGAGTGGSSLRKEVGSASRSRRATSFEPDETAKAYFDKYGVSLEEKSAKYMDDEADLSSFSKTSYGSQRNFTSIPIQVGTGGGCLGKYM